MDRSYWYRRVSIHVSHIAQGRSGITTPLHIAAGANFSLSSGLMLYRTPGISKGLADETVVARLNQTLLWDAMRPLEENCTLELLKWNADNKLVQKVCLTAAVDVPILILCNRCSGTVPRICLVMLWSCGTLTHSSAMDRQEIRAFSTNSL